MPTGGSPSLLLLLASLHGFLSRLHGLEVGGLYPQRSRQRLRGCQGMEIQGLLWASICHVSIMKALRKYATVLWGIGGVTSSWVGIATP